MVPGNDVISPDDEVLLCPWLKQYEGEPNWKPSILLSETLRDQTSYSYIQDIIESDCDILE